MRNVQTIEVAWMAITLAIVGGHVTAVRSRRTKVKVILLAGNGGPIRYARQRLGEEWIRLAVQLLFLAAGAATLLVAAPPPVCRTPVDGFVAVCFFAAQAGMLLQTIRADRFDRQERDRRRDQLSRHDDPKGDPK